MFVLEDRLSALDEEKKIRIINSAMQEFSKNTYQKASTNRIVEKAGISKGSLFNYFKSKEKLYEYLQVFTLRAIADAIVENLDWPEPDILTRIPEIVIIKLEVCSRYPYLMGFSKRIFENRSIDDMKEIVEEHVPRIYEKVYYENIDFSLFREDMGISQVMNVLVWTFEKMGENYLKRIEGGESIDYNEMADEVDSYIEVLKKGFYR